MKWFTIKFTDGRWSFTAQIEAISEEEAIKSFEETYPQMYIEEMSEGQSL